jgi:hypothetical protein
LYDSDESPFVQKAATNQQKSKRQWPWNILGGTTTAPAAASPTAGPTVLEPGFLTAIQLTATEGSAPSNPRPGAREAGYPLQILLQVSTSTSGGRSNSITPAHWANEYVVLTDSEKGLVQVWRFDGLERLPQDAPPASSQPQSPQPRPQQPPVVQQPPVAQQQPSQPQRPPPPKPQPSLSLPGQPGWGPFPQPASPQPPKAPPPKALPSLSLPGQPGWAQVPQPANQPASNPRPQNPRPSPWVNPNTNPGWTPPNPSGQFKRDTKHQRRQALSVRANIVAEWKAPPETVGQGDPTAPRGSNQQNDDRKGGAPGWGRGCCANAVWYD